MSLTSTISAASNTTGGKFDAATGVLPGTLDFGNSINFAAGDVLDFSDGNDPTVVNSDFSDGIVKVVFAWW